jgi:hypothetical protein
MAVLIRPVPPRVAGNRIVPFRPVQYTNKVRPVSLGDWKPPVPEPLPPAPLLGLGTLAVLGAQALAYAWGLLNSRPLQQETVVPVPGMQAAGTVPAAGNTVPGALSITTGAGSYLVSKQNCTPDTPATEITTSGTDTFQNVTGVSFETVAGPCGPNQLAIRLTRFQESDNVRPVLTTSFGIVSYTRPIVFSWAGPNPQPFSFPTSNLGLPSGFVLPTIEPTQDPAPSRTAPAPLPLPLPSTVPQVEPQPEPETLPAPSPLVPVTPGPVAPPIVRPATPFSPQQPKVPAATGTSNGQLNAPARLPVPVTSPTSIIPWPGASAIGTPAQAPRADLPSIAQEIGKIERKLELMNDASRDLIPDSPLDLLGLARLIYEILSSSLGAPTYQLDSPCEVDGDGDKLPPVQVPVAGALTSLDSIANRVDALAELLQVHKNLKQPNCHIPPVAVGGEFVTVNFEQVD